MNEWHRVCDLIPHDNEMVLVATVHYDGTSLRVTPATYDAERSLWHLCLEGTYTRKFVVAWREMPTLPHWIHLDAKVICHE